MGLTTSLVLSESRSLSLYQITPVGHIKRSNNKQHFIYCTNSHNLFRRRKICHQVLQLQRHCMALANTIIITQCFHNKHNIITDFSNINLPYHPTIMKRYTHPSLSGQFQCPGVDLQGIVWPNQRVTSRNSCNIVGMDLHEKRCITTLPTYQRDLKHNIRLAI